MVAVLVGISLISGLALGGLNSLTAERAKNNVLKYKKIPAVADISEGLSGGLDKAAREQLEAELLAEKKTLMITEEGEEKEVVFFVVNRDGEPFGVAIEDFGKGFGGDLGVMVGFNLDTGDLAGIGITSHTETPGVGNRVEEESFLLQFRGMGGGAVFKVKKDGGEIDAVTGATISSRAVAAAIENAGKFYKANQEQIKEIIDQ
jgi:electron transport complex protein RnfG